MDMYSRTGKIDILVNIFDSMVTGYVLSGRHSDALVLLHEMQKVKNNKTRRKNHDDEDENGGFYKSSSITLMTFLPGCAALAALAKGKEIHAYAVRNALASDITVGSSLVYMYAKSGCLNLSRRVFIMAYGMHGKGEEALGLFKKMEAEPNEVPFIALFAACSHSGLINEGLTLFYR